jgi:cephalosporin hydroxylase
MDDRQQFAAERADRLSKLAEAQAPLPEAKAFFNATLPLHYSYNFDWLGLPIIQYPQDVMAIQEIVWRTKPDLIIETGVARGGSLILYASLLKLIGNGGRVIGVDIDIRPHNRQSIEDHPLADAIQLVQGSSVDEETVAAVRDQAKGAGRIMVVLDSMHTADHVLRELELYSPLVTQGCYLVVFDTVIEFMPPETVSHRPWGQGNSPFNAVQQFLETNSRFRIDRSLDAKLQVSVAPSGYLECVAD